MPRILHIIPTLDRGGAEKQLALLACGLKDRGWDVHVCCLKHGGPWQAVLESKLVPVTVIRQQWKLDPLAYLRLRRFVAQLKPDLVHTWRLAANGYGRSAAISAGIKHIVAREPSGNLRKRTPQLLIDRWLARRTDRIVTDSSGIVDLYADYGLPREKLVVIPNGVERFEADDTLSRAELLQELDLPASAKLIGAVGRLCAQKRYKDLIWALDLLRCVHDDARLLVIGEGPHRWRLERYARQVTGSEAVRFLGERSDVASLLPHLSCFWLASAHEGQSNALLEAMSAGLPVAVSDISGNRDLVTDGQTGFLVRLGDRAGFAARASELLKDPALGQRLGAAAKLRVEQEFGVDRMVDAHESLYRSLLGSGASTSLTQ